MAYTTRPELRGTFGMVTSTHWLASAAGMAVPERSPRDTKPCHVTVEEQVPVTTACLPYRALWIYYASFAAHAQLWAVRPEKPIEYLYGFANQAAPTGVWREEQPLGNGGHVRVGQHQDAEDPTLIELPTGQPQALHES